MMGLLCGILSDVFQTSELLTAVNSETIFFSGIGVSILQEPASTLKMGGCMFL
jgi:hypothetical protein